MVTYTVDLPLTLPKTAIYKTWQEQEVASRIFAYNSTNPLGISTNLNWIVAIYYPVLILLAGTLNVFALYVLRSNFLRYLVIQPLIRALLHLQTLLLFVGPFYIWLVQYFRLSFSRHQLYPCFLVVWGHNFAALATSSILVAMLLERALTIGRSEVLWDVLQKACRNVISLLLLAALVLGVGGLICIDGVMENKRVAYPICLPWWSNEHGLVSPLWYKILACCFTLGPSLLIMLSIGLLVASVIRFKQMMRSGTRTLNYYNALYLEIRSTLHVKFVNSVWSLGSLFVLASSPLGCFIIFGPAIYYRLSTEDGSLLSNTVKMFPYTTTNTADFTKVENESTMTHNIKMVHSPRLAPLEYSYLLVSRSDAETLLWTVYYSFTLFIVPVLLATEVLFRREWKEQLENSINGHLFGRNKLSRWSGCDITECYNGDFIGPYVAKSNGRTKGRLDELENGANIKVYDAGKTERAGRKFEINKVEYF